MIIVYYFVRCLSMYISFILFLYFANCMGGSKPGTEVL